MPDFVPWIRIAEAIGAREQAAVDTELEENLIGEFFRGNIDRRAFVQKLPRQFGMQCRFVDFPRRTGDVKRIFVVVSRE